MPWSRPFDEPMRLHERKLAMTAGRNDLAIVILPQDQEDGTFRVCLRELDANGNVNWDGDDFIVARTNTLDAAANYSQGLADILKFKVLQLKKS